MNSLDLFFFSAYPYVAIFVFLVGVVYRYKEKGYKLTSLSAQFLEGKQGFWGTVPFHWGILMIFLGHLVAFLFPKSVLTWNSDPARLIIHEGLAFTFAVALTVGLVGLIIRRLTNAHHPAPDQSASESCHDSHGSVRRVFPACPGSAGVLDCVGVSLGFVLVCRRSVTVPVVNSKI